MYVKEIIITNKMFFNEQKVINKIKIINKEYCKELENILIFFRQDENINYNIDNDDKNFRTFKNLNILYKNYFYFQVLKEFYEQCKN